MTPTRHFRKRVRERIGPHIDPDFLAEGIAWAIREGRSDLVRYAGRLDRTGRRVFHFAVPLRGEIFRAIVNTTDNTLITVMLLEDNHDTGSGKSHPSS